MQMEISLTHPYIRFKYWRALLVFERTLRQPRRHLGSHLI